MEKFLPKIRRSAVFQFVKKEFIFKIRAAKYYARKILKNNYVKHIYVFNHIPKCGGTSLIKILSKWFVIVKDYPPHDLKFPNKEEQEMELRNYILSKPNLNDLKPWQMISGHYHLPEFEISSRFPGIFDNKTFRVITFIREPLDHVISHYYYGIRRGHSYMNNVTLEEFLLRSFVNPMSHSLGCNEQNYKHRLDQYFFIGDVDHFNQSIKALSKLMGKRVPKIIPHTNRTVRPDEINDISIDLIREFKKLNSLDYLVYDYAKRIAIKYIDN